MLEFGKNGPLAANDQETANVLCGNFEEVFVKEDCNEVVKSNEVVTGEKPENRMKICDDEDTVSQARSNSNIIGEKPHEEMTGYNSEQRKVRC